jgi:hypothetical protein
MQVTASTEAQAGVMLLGALAQSQNDNTIRAEDSTVVQIDSVLAAAVRWQPTSLNILTSPVGMANLTIENAGNTDATFNVSLNTITHVTATLPFTQVVLPHNGQVMFPIDVTSDLTGTYQLIATVTGGLAPVQANLAVNVNLTPRLMYLPFIARNYVADVGRLYLPIIFR